MNIFDSFQNNNINNTAPIPAKKMKDKIIGVVVYPEPIKNYSIEKALAERDEFRKSVIENSIKKEKRASFNKKALFVAGCALTAAIFSFIKK